MLTPHRCGVNKSPWIPLCCDVINRGLNENEVGLFSFVDFIGQKTAVSMDTMGTNALIQPNLPFICIMHAYFDMQKCLLMCTIFL